MQPELDFKKSAAAAVEGMDRARYGLPGWNIGLLDEARKEAVRIAERQGSVTADDVVESFLGRGIDLPAKLGPAMGSLFRGTNWHILDFERSRRVSNHARILRVWEWKGRRE